MDNGETHYAITVSVLVLSLVSNLIFVLSLIHTWKHWRQIKWYVILLCVSNWLEIFFSGVPEVVALNSENSLSLDSDATCKFMSGMSIAGFILWVMSMAATAVHVLMTAITGHQGNKLRHALTVGLFVMLSLPLIVLHMVRAERIYFHDGGICLVMNVPYLLSILYVDFFPALICLGCLLPAVLLILMKRKGNKSNDISLSDAVLSGVLGVVFLVTTLPSVAVYLGSHTGEITSMEAVMATYYLLHCRKVLSAIAIVIFAYASVFRSREAAPALDSTAMGERQKLVN